MLLRKRLERSTWLPRPVEEVFAFFADATNLERITPPELRFRIVSPLPIEMRRGTLIEYRLALFQVPFGWRTEISDWSPPWRFVDRQLAGPYRSWIHTHSFSTERRGTLMRDQVDYVLPLGTMGLLAAPLVRRELDRIFDYRANAIGALLA
ncbi:MAG TPA: SRPBCC family protein [Steroidobacteraceae bacterium]|nr:SRPBCC family protein [Steroidobacteraceae bacterium]